MLWTDKDDETVRECRECLANCRHYHTTPAPWFTLLLQMHEALTEAGLLEREPLEVDYCFGCVHDKGAGCLRAYREATLDQERRTVVACGGRTTVCQANALERAAKKRRK